MCPPSTAFGRLLSRSLSLRTPSAGPQAGGSGVDLFFVLSGFLITTLLLERRGRYSIGDFYRRRALRLLPALVVLLGVAFAVDRSLFGALAGLGYVSNFVMAGGGEQLPASLTHLWSLAAEEQFYIVGRSSSSEPSNLVLGLRWRSQSQARSSQRR